MSAFPTVGASSRFDQPRRSQRRGEEQKSAGRDGRRGGHLVSGVDLARLFLDGMSRISRMKEEVSLVSSRSACQSYSSCPHLRATSRDAISRKSSLPSPLLRASVTSVVNVRLSPTLEIHARPFLAAAPRLAFSLRQVSLFIDLQRSPYRPLSPGSKGVCHVPALVFFGCCRCCFRLGMWRSTDCAPSFDNKFDHCSGGWRKDRGRLFRRGAGSDRQAENLPGWRRGTRQHGIAVQDDGRGPGGLLVL